MRRLLVDLLDEPNRESYLALHASVVGSPEYSAYSDELGTVSELIDQQRHEEARAYLQRAMANLLLSPRAHLVSAVLHSKAGNEGSAELEMALREACLAGMLATGDGTEARPYLVVRPSDEHDLLEHLGKRLRKQGLRTRYGRHFDQVLCTDESEIWFDITAAFRSLRNR